jgi:hypothetical protein
MPGVILTARDLEEIPKALERRRQLRAGVSALAAYIPLDVGVKYTEFATRVVKAMQEDEVALLAKAYEAGLEKPEIKTSVILHKPLSDMTDAELLQHLRHASGKVWVEEAERTAREHKKMRPAIKTVLERAGEEWKTDDNVGHHVSLTLTVRELRALQEAING